MRPREDFKRVPPSLTDKLEVLLDIRDLLSELVRLVKSSGGMFRT